MIARAGLLVSAFCQIGHTRKFLQSWRRVLKMPENKVVVTHEENASVVGISFRYKNEVSQIDRTFNLQRSIDEQLGNVLTRISSNIAKVANKKKNKNKNNIVEIPVKLVKTVDEADVADEGVSCHQAFVAKADEHNLVIGEDKYSIDVNPPIVKTVDLPKSMMAGFPVYPNKFEVMFADKESCVLDWFKSDLKFETVKEAQNNLNQVVWLTVNSGYNCNTTNDDIGRLIKVVVTPTANGRKGEEMEVISPVLVSAGPGECPFERRHTLTKEHAGANRLRVVCYNILADLYADSDFAKSKLFSTCPPYAIDLDYRKQLLIKELIGYNADLVCLQELDERLFVRDLQPTLEREGLEGYYDAKGGQVTEGCGIFFRKSKLRMVDHTRIILSDELQSNPLFEDWWEKISSNVKLVERVVQRTTTLQISVLESIEDPSKQIVVGVTHLYFYPDADNIRLLQAGISMRLLQQVMSLCKTKHPEKDISLLFCGDFNSTPEFGVYRFMKTQFIDTDDPDWSSMPEECVQGIQLSHDLEIDSACGCPEYTNYTVGFNGCLDYIFYQNDKFSVKQVIPMPTHEEVTEHIALPSVTFPSDHIALVADLEYKATGKDPL
ncbi:2',5'-phosphodiesterase 12-like [Penaeus japonicus]|uniref:2',5'-phosphodiesterase 12-like n=1 Tax=Penaeus japonicus TaxID=27405 RepID=UPI001C70B119|nr:2',5'-phosphodiesterase 12-like [Penaeus japonicus]